MTGGVDTSAAYALSPNDTFGQYRFSNRLYVPCRSRMPATLFAEAVDRIAPVDRGDCG
jgi:hypothetical protein